MIGTNVLKDMGSKIKDSVNQNGQSLKNCYYCKKVQREGEMVRKELNSKNHGRVGGDCLIICRDCAAIVGE